MFARRRYPQTEVQELERIEEIVRARYAVPADQIVLVSEDENRLPGMPDRMTTILFWLAPERRCKVRVFKPASEVSHGDLPPHWLRGALLDDTDQDCC
jgi:hypothetical protein